MKITLIAILFTSLSFGQKMVNELMSNSVVVYNTIAQAFNTRI